MFQGTALAASYLLRAGCVPTLYDFTVGGITKGTFVYNADGTTKITAGQGKVEAFWIGNNGVINDPTYGDDYQLPYTKVNATRLVGDDGDTWVSFTGSPNGDGHFYHEWGEPSTTINAGSYLYVRVWDSANPGAGSKFGESIDTNIRAAYGEPAPSQPSNFGLTDFSTILPQSAPVLAPTGVTLSANQAPGAGQAPSLTINFNKVVGARWYIINVSDPKAENTGEYIYAAPAYKTSTSDNPVHIADINTVAHQAITISLNTTDDTKWFKVKVIPYNDHGAGISSESDAKLVPETPDANIPVAVTDLIATYSQASKTIMLNWSPAYDMNKYNVLTAGASYEIRVSREAITALPQTPFSAAQTNPQSISSWDSAISIYNPEISSLGISQVQPITPSLYSTTGDKDSATISGSFSGTYYFALKARDSSGNWSYVSNVTGVSFGGGGPIQATPGIYTWNFDKPLANGLAVNQFQFYVNPARIVNYSKASPVDFELGTNVGTMDGTTTPITVKKLVEAINEYAASKGVPSGNPGKLINAIGWWNSNPGSGQEQRMEGYTLTYGVGTITWVGSAGVIAAGGGSDPLVLGRTYQVSVAAPLTGFTIRQLVSP